jgi:2-hydroxy-3-keto-5-methylthiopentenyl-1-phosphate phosphatase
MKVGFLSILVQRFPLNPAFRLKSAVKNVKQVVFCDFDGTITIEESFVAVLKKFAPEMATKLLPEMYAQRVTLRQGVRTILESIPSINYPEIINFTRSQTIRPGFEELLDFLELQEIPLVVVSGGLRGMVEIVLGELVQRVHAIHAVDIDTSGEYFQVCSDYEGGTELIAKVQVMAEYPAEETIAIGDSLTDLNMALQASVVFARDRLADYLEAKQKPYIPWHDFHQVRDYLTKSGN